MIREMREYSVSKRFHGRRVSKGFYFYIYDQSFKEKLRESVLSSLIQLGAILDLRIPVTMMWNALMVPTAVLTVVGGNVWILRATRLERKVQTSMMS